MLRTGKTLEEHAQSARAHWPVNGFLVHDSSKSRASGTDIENHKPVYFNLYRSLLPAVRARTSCCFWLMRSVLGPLICGWASKGHCVMAWLGILWCYVVVVVLWCYVVVHLFRRRRRRHSSRVHINNVKRSNNAKMRKKKCNKISLNTI